MNTYQDRIFTVDGLRKALLSLMDEKGLTQSTIEQETGVRQSQISFFLNGKRDLAAKAILRLLEFYFKHQDTHNATETR